MGYGIASLVALGCWALFYLTSPGGDYQSASLIAAIATWGAYGVVQAFARHFCHQNIRAVYAHVPAEPEVAPLKLADRLVVDDAVVQRADAALGAPEDAETEAAAHAAANLQQLLDD
jgi:hypothetical protein